MPEAALQTHCLGLADVKGGSEVGVLVVVREPQNKGIVRGARIATTLVRSGSRYVTASLADSPMTRSTKRCLSAFLNSGLMQYFAQTESDLSPV